MKFSDIIVENKKQELTEKPMGFLKTMGNKVASTFGSGQAQGRLDTGKEANTLRKDFDIFLGKTGQNPTGDLVLQFLKQKGYPTKSAQNFIAAGKPQTAQQPAAQQGQQPAPNTTEPSDQTPTNAAAPVAQQPSQPAAGAGAIAQFVKQQTGDNPITMKPAPQKAPAQPAATLAAPVQPAGRIQGGGKVPGQLSQTPGAVKKRQARAVKKRTAHPADDNPNIQLGTESIEYTFESRLNFYLLKEEVLSGKQLDQIFLAAAQEKAKGGSSAVGGTQPAAASGDTLSQPSQPSQQDKGDSFAQRMAAAAYDGMRGASLGATKIGQPEIGKELKDTSGRIPENIMGQLNQLTNKQRAQLRKELDKA